MRSCLCVMIMLMAGGNVPAEPPQPSLEPLVRSVDLAIGQVRDVQLSDGKVATVKLLAVEHVRDTLRDAVRKATARVEVNGQEITLDCGNYNLPRTIAGVQIDCPITKGYLTNSRGNAWGLETDARLRLWPAGSPWMNPGTFVYPVKQRWFASSTQLANEPCYVDSGDVPRVKDIYYHYGLDFGGCEGLVEVVAATDGLVVSAGKDRLPGYDGSPAKPRYDVVYVLDARGWYYRYSHLAKIEDVIRPDTRIKAGQRIGMLGKEGASGGWTHLHFDIFCRQPSGKWGCQEGYAFVWEAYQREQHPKVIAVARPHHLVWAGEEVTLDGTRSWCEEGQIARYEWTFCDGTRAQGARVKRAYPKPGYYSEILKITTSTGLVDYDFAIVCVQDKQNPAGGVPTIHATYHPTSGIKPNDEITLKVRTFGTTDGEESWDFGDDTPPGKTKSDGCVKALAKDGYAVTTHRYQKAGNYIVTVQRTNARGQTATARLHVIVAPAN